MIGSQKCPCIFHWEYFRIAGLLIERNLYRSNVFFRVKVVEVYAVVVLQLGAWLACTIYRTHADLKEEQRKEKDLNLVKTRALKIPAIFNSPKTCPPTTSEQGEIHSYI